MADLLGASGLNQLGGMYDDDMIREASQLAGVIKSYRAEAKARKKSEALSPFVSALQGAANQYNTAADDTGRANATALASRIRENMLRGGFSPSDIDQRYWGPNPSSGFHTPSGFQAPVTGYEGLGRTEAINALRQSMLDSMARRETEAGLSGIDPTTGQKTWDRQLQEMQFALSAAKGSGGGSGGSTKAPPSLYDQAKAAAYNDPRLWMGDEEPPEGRWTLEGLQNAYINTYGGGGQAQPAGGGGDPQVAALVQQARAEGASDDEIRATLANKGHNPAEYGL